MNAVNMPKYQPVPLRTVGKNIFIQFKRWLWDARVNELTDDFFYVLSDGQSILIPKGFRTDFASSPRIFWPLGMDPVGVLLIPSLLHDFGYRHGFYLDGSGERIIKTLVWEKHDHDALFRKVSDEVNGFKAPGVLACAALGIFGWPAWWSALKNRTGSVDLIGQYRDFA